MPVSNVNIWYYDFFLVFSLWERALPATLFDAELYLPSLKIEDACDATLGEVTFFAI